ncbi:hypothetical protein MTR_1g050570 [Medicago truncatula]|uniref:Uncharacterized protein n=1 Tax=Medicago truncatula TaxID=3880 RepID=G7I7D2_MEDTR|nr:hypothetical protein MTR_1g050570 [Medicago truncatula]
MDEILNLQKEYCDVEDSTRSKFFTDDQVGDPVTVKRKGAPKKKKNATKSVRHCSRCKSTSHTARNCSDTHNAKLQYNEELVSISMNDSLSQKEKKKKRKPNGNASTSKQKKCKEATKIQEIPETADSPVTNAVQPPVNVLQPSIIPMQMQAIYPNYGLHGGESSTSCVGLLA